MQQQQQQQQKKKQNQQRKQKRQKEEKQDIDEAEASGARAGGSSGSRQAAAAEAAAAKQRLRKQQEQEKRQQLQQQTFRKEYVGASRIRASGRLSEASSRASGSVETAWELYKSAVEWGSALLPTTRTNRGADTADVDALFGTASSEARVAFRNACACIDDNVKLFDRALRNFDIAIHEDAYFLDARLGRARLHLRMRRFDKAIADFRLGLTLCRRQCDQKRTIDALHGRAQAYVAQNMLDRAIQDLSDALELDPNTFPALILRSEVYLRVARPNEALADAEKALSSCETKYRSMARAQLAIVLSSMGQRTRAIKEANKAVEADKNNAGPYMKRAQVLLASGLGREADALQDAEAAVRLGGGGEALIQRAKVRMALEFWEDAVQDISRALETDDSPSDPEWLQLRSQCFAKFGRDEDAITDRVEALRIGGQVDQAIAAFESEARRALALSRRHSSSGGVSRSSWQTSATE